MLALLAFALVAYLAGWLSSSVRQLADVYYSFPESDDSREYREAFESCFAAKVTILGVGLLEWPREDLAGIRAVAGDAEAKLHEKLRDLLTSDMAFALLTFAGLIAWWF